MFGASKLSTLFPVAPGAVIGKGFTIEGELSGVHALTADPASVAVFITGRDNRVYMARFTQTNAMSIELTFSEDPDIAPAVLETHPPR